MTDAEFNGSIWGQETSTKNFTTHPSLKIVLKTKKIGRCLIAIKRLAPLRLPPISSALQAAIRSLDGGCNDVEPRKSQMPILPLRAAPGFFFGAHRSVRLSAFDRDVQSPCARLRNSCQNSSLQARSTCVTPKVTDVLTVSRSMFRACDFQTYARF